MKHIFPTLLLIGQFAALPMVTCASSPDPFNVVWDSHSNVSRDSMPVGNGDIGLNVWTEENGDLLFYVGKTDAFDESGRILKLGRIRVHFDNAPFAKGKPFKQELSLQDATIRITAGEGDSTLRLKLWVDANNPVVHLESESATPFRQTVALEMWRTKKRPLSGKLESHYVSGTAANIPPIQYPDTLINGNPAFTNRIAWYHRNETSVRPASLELQWLMPLPPEVRADILLKKTFGAVIQAGGMVSDSPDRLATTAPVNSSHVTLVPLTEQTESAQIWLNALTRLSDRLHSENLTTTRTAHEKWWADFWNRSDITVTGGDPKETAAISQGWQLNRFVTACAARGKLPVKFNGAIFTLDGIDAKSAPSPSATADARAWGIPFWFQNQRHIYWPMLQAGDYDQFASFFKLYRDLLPMARHRARIYFQHGDWVPDLDNGGVCQNTLQSMPMQADEKKIILLPAWPKAWNASFKLHAPKNTVIEARVENGEIKDLKVTPESRRKDVEIREAQ